MYGALADAILDGNGDALTSGNNVNAFADAVAGRYGSLDADRFLLATAILDDPDDHGNQWHGHRRGRPAW